MKELTSQEVEKCRINPILAIETIIYQEPLLKVQKELIKAYRHDAVVCKHSRVLGVTTTNLLYSLYLSIFTQNCDVVFYFHRERQRQYYVEYFLELYNNILPEMKVSIRGDLGKRKALRNYYHTVFASDSRISFLLTSEAVKQYSVEGDTIFVEDFAFEKKEVAERFLAMLYPSINDKNIYISSVPNGYNHFAKLYVATKMNENKFNAIEFDFRDSELIKNKEEFRYKNMDIMGEDRFDIEHKAQFGK